MARDDDDDDDFSRDPADYLYDGNVSFNASQMGGAGGMGMPRPGGGFGDPFGPGGGPIC